MAETSELSLTITHRGQHHELGFLAGATLGDLQQRILELTQVPPHLQKLLYKGKKAHADASATLGEIGIGNGAKIMILGSTETEIGKLKAVEAEKHHRDEIMRQRAAKGPTKLRSTAEPSTLSSKASFKFHSIRPLPHLPNPKEAEALLQRLAEDPAIRHVMQQHEFSVGLLTELAPHEHPHLLGLNENRGQVIKLRLRTNEYDGFRSYKDVRRVLCHELTHNVWRDHDNNFKELNSRLNREVAEYEREKAEGTHYLAGGEAYEPGIEADAHAALLGGTHVLGGSTAGVQDANETREERRRRVLNATISRLQKEEQEIEDMCGSS